jgi:MoaA/NifB/PqqE/SkfB family radical SAM enzyme
MWKAPRSTNEITIEEWKKFIISLKGLLVDQKELIFSGGEPLLKEGIFDLIRFGTHEGFRTLMPTNGWLVTEAIAKEMNASGLKEVFISLDSMNARTHDYLRGKEGVFNQVMKAIEYCDRYRRPDFRISILSVISKKNLDDIPQLLHLLHNDKRISGVYFQSIAAPFFTDGSREWRTSEEFGELWPDDYAQVSRTIDEIIRLKKQRNYIIHNHEKQLLNYKKYFKDPTVRVSQAPCYLGDYVINADHEGNINLCCFEKPIGNIRTDSITELWFSDRVKKIRDTMHRCQINCHNMVNCFFKDDEE